MRKGLITAAIVWTVMMLLYNALKNYPALPLIGAFHAELSIQARYLTMSLTKLKHWFFYSVFFVLVYRGTGDRAFPAFAAALFVGLLGEIEEGFFAGEAARLTDVFANMAAASVTFLILRRRRLHFSRANPSVMVHE